MTYRVYIQFAQYIKDAVWALNLDATDDSCYVLAESILGNAVPSDQPSLIMLVGLPASGKSTVTATYRDTHAVINYDTFRAILLHDVTNQAHNQAIATLGSFVATWLCERRYNIVIDNANLKRLYRSVWYDLATTHGYRIQVHQPRVLLIQCLRRNMRRERRVPLRVMLRLWWGFEPFHANEVEQ